MVRHSRINLPFAVYHVMCRSNMKNRLFRDKADYVTFLYYLEKYKTVFDFQVHAYCLMPTHIHLLVESSRPNLSEFMRRLLISYTLHYHRHHDTRGHVFAGRFQSLVVERGDYMLAASRYIHLNPVEAGYCEKPGAYDWSSMKYYQKPNSIPRWLTVKEILDWFEGNPRDYRRFVEEGLEEDLKPLVWANRYSGGKGFSKRIRARLKKAEEVETTDDREKIAENLVKEVCKKRKCDPDKLRETRRRPKNMQEALQEITGRLRSETDLTFRYIAEFLGISLIYTQKLEKQWRDHQK